MADKTRRIEYYYVTVPDEPGAGAKVLMPLKEAGVNLVAYLGFPAGNRKSQLDLVPENPRKLKETASRLGLALSSEKKAFFIQGDDRVGAVADAVAKLASGGINITAAMATSAGGGKYGMILWVPEGDYEKAAKALGA